MGHHPAGDAELLGSIGVDPLAGEQDLHGGLPPDALWEPDRSDDGRHADPNLGEAERRPLAGDDEVAPGDQREPVAEAVPVHGGDHRFEDLPP